jgi:hypothetical protein
MAPGYGPETWVTVLSRDMGHSVMLAVGPHGGAPCPGDTPPPWTTRPHALPMTFVTVCRSPRSASSTISAVKPALSGLTALSSMARPAWTSAHAHHTPAHARRPMLWWRPSLQPGALPPPGGHDAAGPPHPTPSAMALARTLHRLRAPEPKRAGSPATPSPPHRAAWETGHQHARAPSALDR